MKYLISLLSILFSVFLIGCKDEGVPEPFNEDELINKVELIFSPIGAGAPVSANAFDEDSKGVGDFITSDSRRILHMSFSSF